MDKRVLLMTGVSTALVLGYFAIFKPTEKKPEPAPPAAASVATANPATAAAANQAATTATTAADGDKTLGPPAPPPERPTPVVDTLEVAGKYRAVFTSEGAAPEHF